MKKITCFLLMGLLFTMAQGCKDSGVSGDSVETGITMSLVDKNGKNLLDPSTPNNYNPDSIKLFYLIDGIKKEAINGKSDHPRMFLVNKYIPNGQYYISVGLNYNGAKEGPTTTYLQWNQNDVDTLVAEFKITKSSTSLMELKFNKKLKYTSTIKTIDSTATWGEKAFGKFFEVIK